MNVDDLTGVVVHHRNFPGVLETIGDLLKEGVRAERTVVVNNSEDTEIESALASGLPTGVSLLNIQNRGYGNAVNVGIDWVREKCVSALAVAICTHEIRIRDGAIVNLLHELERDPSLGVVGPVFVRSSDTKVVWSAGGQISRLTGRPYHAVSIPQLPAPRDWIDGAMNLYRISALENLRVDERFFMYYEEVDFHLRLAGHGWRVAVVPDSVVEQDTAGAPPYYVGRNGYLFSKRHSNAWQLSMLLFREMLRLMIRGSRGDSRFGALRAFLKGVADGVRN